MTGPVLGRANIAYELSARTKATGHGGIGLVAKLIGEIGLAGEIDAALELLKLHKPYYESDHVLNVAYNALCGGQRLQDIEARRCDRVLLDGLGTESLPDPTTAGDFCRRFDAASIMALQEAVNLARLKVWQRQPDSFFEQPAVIDADASIVPTDAQTKQGMDISDNGIWGYSALVVSLANTKEPLYLGLLGANRPSHEGVVDYYDRAIQPVPRGRISRDPPAGRHRLLAHRRVRPLGRRRGALRVRLRRPRQPHPSRRARRGGDLSRARDPHRGPDRHHGPHPPGQRQGRDRARAQLQDAAPGSAERRRVLLPSREVQARLPGDRAAQEHLRRARRERPFSEYRYFFYITNDRDMTADEVIDQARQRCDQENLISQLKSDVRALHAPVNTLCANWAYMTMAALAWTLKAWCALLLPITPRWAEPHNEQRRRLLTMDFRTFRTAFIKIPCQIITTGRRVRWRILTYNPRLNAF